MLKIKPILLSMLFLAFLFSYYSNFCYASFNETIQSIENEIIDESKQEPEWLEPQEEQITDNLSKSRGEGIHLLGSYNGLTYYSQADSRWANILYTATNNTSQTMKSSGCGPTAAAIVVSSSKGTILPITMANIFVNKGFRTINNGTSWSAFPFIANYFAFNSYQYTTNFNTAINYLREGYFVIVSCGNGLFTTNGHYVVLVGVSGNTLTIYDTYLYNGKFDIPSRKGKVTINGYNIYCTIDNFKKYANYRAFWCFSNDKGNGNNQTNINSKFTAGSYIVTTKKSLRVRSGPGTEYRIVTKLLYGSKQGINYTQGEWGHLMNNAGWINLNYCSKITANNTNINLEKYTPGSYMVTTKKSLRVRTGPGTKYRIVTKLFYGSKQGIDYTQGDWGHLMNNAGWICLNYCKKI